jgi:hypothetical protein
MMWTPRPAEWPQRSAAQQPTFIAVVPPGRPSSKQVGVYVVVNHRTLACAGNCDRLDDVYAVAVRHASLTDVEA